MVVREHRLVLVGVIVGWYEKGSGIEEYLRLLKMGAQIEDRRLREPDALVKCLAAAGRAREIVRDGHPHLDGAAGLHGGLATQQAAAIAGGRRVLASLHASADDSARDANATWSLTAMAHGDAEVPVHFTLGA